MESTLLKHQGLENFMSRLEESNPHQPEFIQAVHEIAEVIIPFIEENPNIRDIKSSSDYQSQTEY